MPLITQASLIKSPRWGARSQVDDFQVLISEFRSGAERRRQIQTVSKATIKRTYDVQDFVIQNFYGARGGASNGFFLPSYSAETTLITSIAIGASSLVVGAIGQFTATSALRGNWLVVRNQDSSKVEFGRIIGISGNTISVSGTFLDSFTAGDFVDVAFWVRFERSLSIENPIRNVYLMDVNFVELPKEIPTS